MYLIKSMAQQELKILNLNAWLMPLALSIDDWPRLDDIITLIRAHEPDLVSLQEVWRLPCLRHLKRALPEYEFHTNGGFFFNQSGLVTLSKKVAKKFTSRLFLKEKCLGFIERLGAKGFHALSVEWNQQPLVFVNTHLFSLGNAVRGFEVAQQQLAFILKEMGEGVDMILSGDFNMPPRALERITGQEFVRDMDTRLAHLPFSLYQKRGPNKYHSYDTQIDFTITNMKNVQIRTERILEPVVSDHFPELTTLTLHQKRPV